MKTTLNIDDQLLAKAAELTGITDASALVRRWLETLIARESARKLALLGVTEDSLLENPRRKKR